MEGPAASSSALHGQACPPGGCRWHRRVRCSEVSSRSRRSWTTSSLAAAALSRSCDPLPLLMLVQAAFSCCRMKCRNGPRTGSSHADLQQRLRSLSSCMAAMMSWCYFEVDAGICGGPSAMLQALGHPGSQVHRYWVMALQAPAHQVAHL